MHWIKDVFAKFGKHKTEKKHGRAPIVAYLALVLLTLVLLSANLTGGLYARYTSQNFGEDSATVAIFQTGIVPVHTEGLTVSLSPGESQVYAFTLTNQSEVPVRYTVVAENLSGNLPLVFSESTGTIGFEGSTVASLTVAWNSLDASPDFSEKVDVISVRVIVEQID